MILFTQSFVVIFKDRYAHGMGVISENTAYRSVLVSLTLYLVSVKSGIDTLLLDSIPN